MTPEVEAVYISLPNSMHHEWTMHALRAGEHVLCEKPYSTRVADVHEAYDLADARNLVLSEGFMWRHHPQAAALRATLPELGELQTIRATFAFVLGADRATDIRIQADLDGGSLMDVGCYCVSGARLLAGEEPETVYGRAPGARRRRPALHRRPAFPERRHGRIHVRVHDGPPWPRGHRDEGSAILLDPWQADPATLVRDGRSPRPAPGRSGNRWKSPTSMSSTTSVPRSAGRRSSFSAGIMPPGRRASLARCTSRHGAAGRSHSDGGTVVGREQRRHRHRRCRGGRVRARAASGGTDRCRGPAPRGRANRTRTQLRMAGAWGKPADWGFTSESGPSGGSKPLRRGRLLGGTSWLTSSAVRGAAADFDAWAARGNPGWAWADVLPAFRRLESDVDFGGETWHGSDGPLPIARYPDLPRSDIRRAAIDALRASGFAAVADHNDGASLFGIGPMPMSVRERPAGHHVRGIPPAGRATTHDDHPKQRRGQFRAHRGEPLGVGVRLVDGEGRFVGPGSVILAAGAYGSPMILMRSGIGPANHLADVGIATVVDLNGVGANLADHPGIDFDSGWRGAGESGPLLHSIGTFRSSQARPDGPPDLMFWLTDPDAADPGSTSTRSC